MVWVPSWGREESIKKGKGGKNALVKIEATDKIEDGNSDTPRKLGRSEIDFYTNEAKNHYCLGLWGLE